jgi:hypothetical protein
MLQFHLDIVKVDLDVTNTSICKCFICFTYVASISSGCCIVCKDIEVFSRCFRLFLTCVFKCFSYFGRMLLVLQCSNGTHLS